MHSGPRLPEPRPGPHKPSARPPAGSLADGRASSRPASTKPPRLPKALAGPGRSGRPARTARPPGGRAVVAVLGSVAALGASAGSAAAATTPTSSVGGQRTPVARTARRADPMPAGELALLGLVFVSLTAAAPAIARPLLDRGVASRAINEAEADAFIRRLTGADGAEQATRASSTFPASSGLDAGDAAGGATGPAGDAAGDANGAAAGDATGAGRLTPEAAALFQSVFNAIRGQLAVVAKPLIGDAVDAGTITAAQAARIEQRLIVRAHLGTRLAGEAAGIGPATGHTEPLFTGRLP